MLLHLFSYFILISCFGDSALILELLRSKLLSVTFILLESNINVTDKSLLLKSSRIKVLSHDETLHATLHATTELLRVTGFAGVAGNVSCNVPKVEIVPTSATLHASLQMAVTLIATFARSVACNRFIV